MGLIANYLGVAELSALVFGFILLLNFLLCRRFYGRMSRLLANTPTLADTFSEGVLPSVSVIVTAHNQAPELQKNLPLLLEQEYAGSFEVIVVNDNSTDETEDVLKVLEAKYPNLYHTFTPASAVYISHKKVSQTLGVKAAKHEWMLFTQPDCRPQSIHWLRYMASHFFEGTDIVLGYANFRHKRTPFAQSIIFDRLYHQAYYLQKAFDGRAYRGSGCNMAYRKSLFVKNKGFSNFTSLMCGEDDLFVNETATKSNVRVEIRPDAFVRQELPFQRKLWRQDKLFYMETRRYFRHKFHSRFSFNFYMGSLFLLYVSFVATVVLNILFQQWIGLGVVVALYLAYRIVKTHLFTRDAKLMHERPHRVLFPYYELSVPLRNVRYLLAHKFHRKGYYRKR